MLRKQAMVRYTYELKSMVYGSFGLGYSSGQVREIIVISFEIQQISQVP
jgi:hypothetical protein